MAESRFPVARVVGLWLGLVAAESVHGIVRRLVLEPRLRDLRARQAGVFSGALLIVLIFWLTLRWLGPQPARRWWQFGMLWLGLTLAFELGLGRATGMSWQRIASDFDPRRGGLLAFGMLVIVVAPRILAARRNLVQEGPSILWKLLIEKHDIVENPRPDARRCSSSTIIAAPLCQ